MGGLSFGVKPGECFGLLGINGAGKTTSFRFVQYNKKDRNYKLYNIKFCIKNYIKHFYVFETAKVKKNRFMAPL